MANTLRFKRGLVSGIPTAALGEPLFTTDTFDLYIGNGTGNTRFQKYIASGTTSQLLRGDGSLLTMPIVLTSPSNGQVLKYDGTNWVNSADAGVTGSGANGQVTFWNSSSTITGSNNLFWDATNNRLGIGTNTPAQRFDLVGGNMLSTWNQNAATFISLTNSTSGTASEVSIRFNSNSGLLSLGKYSTTTTAYKTFAANDAIIYNNTADISILNDNASGSIKLTAGGSSTAQMTLNSNGRLLLGSTTDNGLRFQVTGDGFFSGSVGIGTSGLTGRSLSVSKNITGQYIFSGGSYGVGVLVDGVIQSDEVGGAAYFRSFAQTQAASFTAGAVYHFEAVQGTFGAGSTVSNQVGFFARETLIGATNNFGFYGNIASGTGRWNLYMNGTANNYLAGSLGIGTTSLTGNNLAVIKNITGTTTAFNIQSAGVIQSDVTGYASYYRAVASTQATTFTLSTLVNFSSGTGAFGAGSTTTNFIGFHAQPMTGGVNNYGFYGEVASGTGRWNLYMVGSAHNYLANNLGINNTTPLTKLHISAGHIFANNGTGVNGGANIYLGSNDFNNSTFWDSAPGIGAVYSATSGVASDLGFYTYAGIANSRTERARIFYTGNIGINTTTDAGFRLDVNGTMRVSSTLSVGDTSTTNIINVTGATASNAELRFINGTTRQMRFAARGDISQVLLDADTWDLGIRTIGSKFIFFSTNGTERMRLDASGNLGLGVTPSAWSGFRALDIGTTGSFVSFTSSPNAQMVANMFWTGSAWQYKTTGGASRVSLNANAIEFWNAASGTGGATITTLTQAMTLDASGNLGVGLTAPRVRVHALLNGNASNGFTGSTIIGQNSSSGNSSYLTLVGAFDADAGIVFTDESVGYRGRIVYSNNNEFMSFWTDLSERMRIHATGNLSLGSTTDAGFRLDVNGTMRVSSANNTTALTVSVGSNASYNFAANSTSGYSATFNINDTALYIGHNSSNRDLRLQTNSTDRLNVKGSGQVRFVPLAAAPTTNVEAGDVYYDSTTNKLRCYNGTTWNDLF